MYKTIADIKINVFKLRTRELRETGLHSECETAFTGSGRVGYHSNGNIVRGFLFTARLSTKMFSRCVLPSSLYLLVVMILRSSEAMTSIHAKCRENVILPCDATHPAEPYRYVTWYKVNGTRTGIIMKYQGKEEEPFNNARTAWLRDGESLSIPGVRPEDSGEYECLRFPHVGGKIRETKLHLNVSECITHADTTATALATVAADTTLAASAAVSGVMSSSSSPCMVQVLEVTPLMVISSFSIIAFVKVIFCILAVWGVFAIRTRLERRRMDIWI
ncbi:uncharacterized protein LOC133138401 [Conger conger]|uniref:uncharacterized protein LOC133138401 n=1 Tax=Conger conger TaxID=82655 RepID=UPI002A5A9BC2|nr:uncharacterized protein LOC133138401 [Conger conger]